MTIRMKDYDEAEFVFGATNKYKLEIIDKVMSYEPKIIKSIQTDKTIRDTQVIIIEMQKLLDTAVANSILSKSEANHIELDLVESIIKKLTPKEINYFVGALS